MEHNGRPLGTFIATKEHRRFVEFANAVRKHRYIGLCYGPAGVGKTLSARRYAHWDLVEPSIEQGARDHPERAEICAALARSRAVFHTPTVLGTLRETLDTRMFHVNACIDGRPHQDETGFQVIDLGARHIEMLIFDEAERLSVTAIEFIRDIFDRTGVGVILIGMPGMEKRLERYPQFYSRVGFAHHYRPLTGDELSFVLSRHWRSTSPTPKPLPQSPASPAAISASCIACSRKSSVS